MHHQSAAFASGSSRYLRISLLHLEFRRPLEHSRPVVSIAIPRLSPGLSQSTCRSAYVRFTPSQSEQRLHPPYYRGCWHGVSQCFLSRYRQIHRLFTYEPFFPNERALRPMAFFTHAALLHQAFAHCARFPLLPPAGVWAVSQSQCG